MLTMSFARFAAVAALAGAVGMLVVSGTPVLVFLVVGDLMVDELETPSYTGHALFATVCAVILAFGMIGAACRLVRPTNTARKVLAGSAIAFGIAPCLIALGNTQVLAAFLSLAQGDIVDAETFTGRCQTGLPLMGIGYGFVLAASACVLIAVFATPSCKGCRRSRLNLVALIVSALASILLVLATALAAYYTWAFHGILAGETAIEPTQIATPLARILLSVYANSPALAGFALTCLLLALPDRHHLTEDIAQAPSE